MTPITRNSTSGTNAGGAYHGYSATDFYDVEPRYGTMQAFRELVDAAHAAGLKIVQDQVANHSGSRVQWTADPPTENLRKRLLFISQFCFFISLACHKCRPSAMTTHKADRDRQEFDEVPNLEQSCFLSILCILLILSSGISLPRAPGTEAQLCRAQQHLHSSLPSFSWCERPRPHTLTVRFVKLCLIKAAQQVSVTEEIHPCS